MNISRQAIQINPKIMGKRSQLRRSMSQKFENLWNLALETQKSVREKTNDLNVGYIQEENAWEVIVKYHGEIGFLEEYGIEVEELIAGYGILKVPASCRPVTGSLRSLC